MANGIGACECCLGISTLANNYRAAGDRESDITHVVTVCLSARLGLPHRDWYNIDNVVTGFIKIFVHFCKCVAYSSKFTTF